MPIVDHSKAMLDLAGGAEKLCVKMEAAFKEGNWQWALELAEVLLDTGHNLPLAKVIFLDFFHIRINQG